MNKKHQPLPPETTAEAKEREIRSPIGLPRPWLDVMEIWDRVSVKWEKISRTWEILGTLWQISALLSWIALAVNIYITFRLR